jgi:hypothetical protein
MPRRGQTLEPSKQRQHTYLGVVREEVNHVIFRHALPVIDILEGIRAQRIIFSKPINIIACAISFPHHS